MSKFIDVIPYHWAFNDIEEMYYQKIPDGTYFFSGIPYNIFEIGKRPVDIEIPVSVSGQSEFVIDGYINPTSDNPFLAYVDGIEVGYDEVVPDKPSIGKSFIKLKRGVRIGSTVRFYSAGVPAMIENDIMKRPVGVDSNISTSLPYAQIPLDDLFSYLYDPLNALTVEVAKWNGRQLRRVNLSDEIKFEDDYSIINNRLYTHYYLNNALVEVIYLTQKDGIIKSNYTILKPHSDSIIYTNRFFPDTIMSRAEAITIVNKIRITMCMKYTDSTAWRSK